MCVVFIFKGSCGCTDVKYLKISQSTMQDGFQSLKVPDGIGTGLNKNNVCSQICKTCSLIFLCWKWYLI